MEIMDYIKASRRGSRNAELYFECGWKSKHKIHSTKKDYSRKIKHKKFGELIYLDEINFGYHK